MKRWLSQLFSPAHLNRLRTARRRQRPLTLESMESRVVPALMLILQEAGVNGGVPTVVSTAADFTSTSFTGTYGDFSVKIFGGASDNAADLSDLLSSTTAVQNIGTSTATLNLTMFQDNYTLPAGGPLELESGLGGSVNSGTFTLANIFQAYASSTNNTTFDFTNGPQSATATGSTFKTGSATGLFNRTPGSPYSLSSAVAINLTAGGKINFASHVNVNPIPIKIGDFVWADANANGVQDAGEAGIQGVKLTLTGTTGAGAGVTDTATTDAAG
ncbi:MAG: conserved repeat domain protein, partial [Gemmataceae bacterium]|nr:conserved repeat domain protein [Gemmataceae bacterium]